MFRPIDLYFVINWLTTDGLPGKKPIVGIGELWLEKVIFVVERHYFLGLNNFVLDDKSCHQSAGFFGMHHNLFEFAVDVLQKVDVDDFCALG